MGVMCEEGELCCGRAEYLFARGGGKGYARFEGAKFESRFFRVGGIGGVGA